ncbi:MAG TPA: SDR family oxidoreductase [Myxococcales bacterium]|nr:SDR family oxidoreductase [Myxococcales bacterium]
MILVTGATGTVGSSLIAQLRDGKEPVRALVHSPQKASQIGANVEAVVGDLDAPETLRPAMAGVRAVYAIAFFTRQIENLVDAAKRAGVKLIVRQSTIEAGATPPFGPGKWHREQEEVIERSGLGWVHLRPTLMMTNTIQWWAWTIQNQRTVYFPGGDGRVSPVDPTDVAAVGRAVLTSDAHRGRAYEVTGPESLSIRDMVAILSRVLGGPPIQYVDIPESVAAEHMRKGGASEELAAAMIETLGAIRSSRYAHVADTVARLTGRPGRTFEDWCRAHAAGFIPGGAK